MKHFLLKRKKAFTIYLIACLFPIANQLGMSLVFAILLGTVEAPSPERFRNAVLISIGIIFASSALFMLSRFMRIRFMRDTLLDIRIAAFDKIMSLSFEAFNQKSKANYVSNLINDINLFEQNFFIRLLNIIFRGGTYIISLIILAVLDWKYASALLVASFAIFLFTRKFEAKTVALQENVSQFNEDLTVEVSNTLEGMEILKLNNIQKPFYNKTMAAFKMSEQKRFRYQCFSEGQRSVTRLLAMTSFILILVYVMLQVKNGMSMTRASLMVMIGNGCIWPLEQVMPMVNELKASLKILDKITKPEENSTSVQEGVMPFALEEALSVKDLSYTYEAHPVLKHVNLSIEKGKKYLIKGPSGSGKSTLLKILSRTLSGYEGTVAVDGVDYREICQEDFNRKVGFIYQDVFLFEDSLYNNITLYKPVLDVALSKAIEGSGLSPFVQTHPEGIQKVLEENGKNLSGGQRQRVSIARALVRDADVIFADEATSSLNEELGRAVENTLLSMETTLVAISHRFYEGVTEKYDYVIEIKNGYVSQYPSNTFFKEAVA